jgi:hypothetical protein
VLLHPIALRHTTLGRTPLGEGSARHRDLYVTTDKRDRLLCLRLQGRYLVSDSVASVVNFVIYRQKGHAVLQLVEALRGKSEGRGFDSRWCHWNFLLTSFRRHYNPGVDSASNRNECQECFLGVKAAGA